MAVPSARIGPYSVPKSAGDCSGRKSTAVARISRQ
jgi:hypothetical protein